MRRIRPIFACCGLLVVSAALLACRPLTPAPALAGPASASPMSEREKLEAERWERATRGLHFETPSGLVEVERIVTGSPLSAAEHQRQGDELLALNREMEALEEYGLAVRNDPQLARAYVGIGAVLERKGKLEPALASFRTAVDRDGRDLEARYELATALWTASRQAEAVAQMQSLLSLKDDYGPAHERLAVWSYYRGEHDAAWRHLHRAQELGNPVPAQLAALLAKEAPDPGAR